jgi:hypothetical protein
MKIKEDDMQKVRTCIGLLNSMVLSGEYHSKTSERILDEANQILDKWSEDNV